MDSEEASFARSLERGEALFARYAADALERGHTTLDGADVWRLYDTFGFPVDLTRLMAEERGLVVNEESFEKAKQKSLEVSKSNGKVSGGDVVHLGVHGLGMLEGMEDVPKTKDDAKFGTPTNLQQTLTDHSLPFDSRRYSDLKDQGHLPEQQLRAQIVTLGTWHRFRPLARPNELLR